MKHITLLLLSIFILTQTSSNAQEGTKIPFDKGVLKICSSKNFIIKGYDGKEVIIKNLHKIVEGRFLYRNLQGATTKNRTRKGTLIKNVSSIDTVRVSHFPVSKSLDSTYVGFLRSAQDKNRSKGLHKLGKKAAAEESGIYLKVEQKGDELIIKDDLQNMFVMTNGEKYEISIPNSISLNWNTSECDKNSLLYYNSNTSEIKNFKGEVEISSALNELKLIDVSGPVSITTIGGNVTVEFNESSPNELYSIYSNNGFIDIKLPSKSNMSIDASATEILSDLDFTVVSEKAKNGAQQMHLKLGTGKVKMKLDASLGNIYLRKQ